MACSWYGYEDGTAEIYAFSFGEGDVVIEIPGSLGGYTMTKLTGEAEGAAIGSLVIPESIRSFGRGTFAQCAIGELCRKYDVLADAGNLEGERWIIPLSCRLFRRGSKNP